MKWCCQVVSVESAISTNQARISPNAQPRKWRPYAAQSTAVSATCSEGAWLKGWSNCASARNMPPNRPLTGGRVKPNLSGTTRNPATQIACTAISRRPCVRSSARVRHRNSDPA